MESRVKHGRSSSGPIIDATDHDDLMLWKQSWSVIASGAGRDEHVILLVRAFLLAPDAINLTPQCDEAIQVLTRVVDIVGRGLGRAETGEGTAFFSTALEAVVDVVRKRMCSKVTDQSIVPDPAASAAAVERLSGAFRTAALALINATNGDEERASQLLIRVKDVKSFAEDLKNEAIARESRNLGVVPSTGRLAKQWNGWTNPTVGWLMSHSWHKVDEMRSLYKDADEYAHILARMWTVLTFYWGSGAVWQKCRCLPQGSENACGEPLLTVTEGGHCSFKTAHGVCGEPAAFRCHRRGHDEICARCLVGRQELMVGSPGPAASTDIYDASVDRETLRREGVVFLLSGLRSRKPPKIDPNWNTTYRLQPSALVAVVKLGVSGERLPRDCPLQWAEVVSIDPKDHRAEKGYRERGQIALRLLTRGDIPALSAEVETPLETRSPVAIIDLRVFVPEVVSVLATLTNDSFATHLAHMPYISRLIGNPPPLLGFAYSPTASICENVTQAISHSEIEFVHRLDAHRRADLARQICALQPVRSLYGTQLEAFSSALATSIHCTQGPPGTGKSYIGVCLVLALDIIRSAAQAEGQAVGPVVILSYKNHALDEFLEDVVRFSNFRERQLIRAGKPESEGLCRFAEKLSPGERVAQDELSACIAVQRHARKASTAWRNVAHSLDSGQVSGSRAVMQWSSPAFIQL